MFLPDPCTGNTGLLDAAQRRDLPQLKRCLENGEDVNTQNSIDKTTGAWASQSCFPFVSQQTTLLFSFSWCEWYAALHWAIRWRHRRMCRLLLKLGAVPTMEDATGETALDLLAEIGTPDLLACILAYDPPPSFPWTGELEARELPDACLRRLEPFQKRKRDAEFLERAETMRSQLGF